MRACILTGTAACGVATPLDAALRCSTLGAASQLGARGRLDAQLHAAADDVLARAIDARLVHGDSCDRHADADVWQRLRERVHVSQFDNAVVDEHAHVNTIAVVVVVVVVVETCEHANKYRNELVEQLIAQQRD